MSASCPVHGPRVVQSASWPVRDSVVRELSLASWPVRELIVRELTSPRIDQSEIRLSAIWFVREMTSNHYLPLAAVAY